MSTSQFARRPVHGSLRSNLCLPIGAVAVLLGLTATAAAQHGTQVQPPETEVSQHPLSESELSQIDAAAQQLLQANPLPEPGAPDAVQILSRRGDACFFLSRFPEAVQCYRQMVREAPELDRSHWRLGIALFFAGQPEAAADQFDKYHSFDDVDRENGIWRYLSHYKAFGAEQAQQQLLRYEKDDREPFPAVYKLFQGTLTARTALQAITDDLSEAEREKRLFYTELYIGMHLVVQGQADPDTGLSAAEFLRRAVSRKWPRQNGFGPDYMWHVARVQYELLNR